MAVATRNARNAPFFFPKMDRTFVLPPRRHLTLREVRSNVKLEWLREYWQREAGLQLVHELKHRDAELHWLAQLFPLQEGKVSDEVADQRLSEWCAAHPEDARALARLATLRRDDSLMEKAASMGDARALGKAIHFSHSEDAKFEMARSSAEKGDAVGMYRLAHCVWKGIGCKKDDRFEELLERAAELGHYHAFCNLADNRCLDPVQKVKLLFSFFGFFIVASDLLSSSLAEVLRCHAADGSDGVIFQVGEMLKGNIDAKQRRVLGVKIQIRAI